ncbi:MAG: trypsin-like peptidase domain-containing protein [Oscillospiraceae bacterium]|nr:trypsin-like peptidase domain-containing protein [Oscillospiraceae bacterium]
MYQDDEKNFPWTYKPEQPSAQQEQPFPQEAPLPQYEPAPVQEEQTSKKKRSSASTGKIVALALCCSLLGGILGSVGGALAMKTAAPQNNTVVLEGQRENTVLEIHKIDTSKLMTPAEVYAANVNSTVGITTTVTTNFWGFQSNSAASGSGFIISKDGYILTNQHVIEDSSSITVSFYDGSSKEAQLVGYDASNDIAVLKVEAQDLSPVVLGNSENLNVGDSVVAIGNPLGELTFSLTAGAVSATEREITTSNGVTMNLMQTDCAINSGNSGGALFNLYGEVVGITNAKYSSSGTDTSIDNIGFAIPVNRIRSIVESIIEKGYIAKPYLGVSLTDVSAETQSYGLPQGASVKEVSENSPAANAGLQVNDIITHVDGLAITGSSDVVKIVGECEVGQVLKLTVYRMGITMDVEITVGEQIQNATPQETTPQHQYPNFPFGGNGMR